MKDLPRILTAKDITMLVMGGIIGSGIFLTAGRVLEELEQSVPLTLLAWSVGGAVTLAGALTYGELAAARPQAGGFYVYIRECFGSLPAFLFGWVYFLIIGMGALATLAMGFAETLAKALDHLPQLAAPGPVGQRALALLLIVFLTALNFRGTRQGADFQNWTTLFKAVALLLFGVVLVSLGREFGAGTPPEPAAETARQGIGLGVFVLAMVPVMFSFNGWQRTTASAGETVDAQRAFPRGLLIGVGTVVGLYLLANVGYLAALGPAGMVAAHHEKNVAPAALAAVLGAGVQVPVLLVICLSIAGSANSHLLTAPRISYAMARDGLFFRQFALIHSRYRTPAVGMLVGGIWAAFLVVTLGDFNRLLNFAAVGTWLFSGLAAAAVFVYRRRLPAAERPYRVPGYPVVPAVFVLACVLVVANLVIQNPQEARYAVGIILAGIPAYFAWRFLARGKDDGRPMTDDR